MTTEEKYIGQETYTREFISVDILGQSDKAGSKG